VSESPDSVDGVRPSTDTRRAILERVKRRLPRLIGRAKDILILFGIVAIMNWVGRLDFFQNGQIRDLIQSFGPAAPLAFLSFCVLTTLAFIPPTLPIGLASIAFGHARGGALALVGIASGACVAYLIGRHSVPHVVTKLKGQRFALIERWLGASNSFLCLLCLRLVFFCDPTFNYLSGTIREFTPRVYAAGTLLGIAPRTFMISYFFDLFTRSSLRETLTNPLVLSFPLVRVAGVLLLTLLVKRRARGIA
jgi:uncharacterized membrane protein YdjX (TVP38/TMEM64 family)